VGNLERRFAGRRPVGVNLAVIMWGEGPGPSKTMARLMDIGRGGASFVSVSPPPTGRDVCIRLETPRETGWVLARVTRSAGTTEVGLSLAEGGLSFSRDFPHDHLASLI
jgi:hypothetical protein